MAKTHWIIIFGTFLGSCISLVLLIVSMCTPYWIVSSAKHQSATRDSEIHYGLFSGSLTKYVLQSGSEYDLTITCDYGQSACIYSCQQSSDARLDELRRILNNETLANCPPTGKIRQFIRYNNEVDRNDGIEEAQKNNGTRKQHNSGQLDATQYIISGYWASTVTFMSLSLTFTAIVAVVSIVNVIYNPVELIFSIFGLYIWNAVAIVTMTLTLILWGALFDTSLQYNIAITDTLSPTAYTSEGLTSLGYSFWIIFVSIALSIVNISLLLLRKHFIEKQSPPPTITVERNDYTIMLY